MTIVNYDWDEEEDNIVEEYDDTGTTVAEYTAEPGLYGNVVSQRRNGQDSYYHYDGQGSTLALTNASGDVTDTRSYTAFGEVTLQAGSMDNPFQYIGRKGYYRDAETGEYDVRHRSMYAVGRWLSSDAIGSLLLQGIYKYVLNRPTIYTDASGTKVDDTICCECGFMKYDEDEKGRGSITVPRSDGQKPDRRCALSIRCEPTKDCDGLPGSTHIRKSKAGDWLVTVCVSCRYRPTYLVFMHEMKHAAQFCSDPNTFNDENQKNLLCPDCESYESVAHKVNCDAAFKTVEERDICVKCGTAISCSLTCTGKKEGPWFVTLEGGEQHRCDIDKDLGGVWLPVPKK